MSDFPITELEEAKRALSSMLHKCEKAQEKLAEGTWQRELMKNNIRAIQIALLFITGSPEKDGLTKAELEEAAKVLTSTLHRVEKAQEKLKQGTPQMTLAVNRIRALEVALALIEEKI